MEWVTTTAKTLPEAIDLALDNLGVDESEAEIVVLEEPSKGLFGRVRGTARVEARVKPKAIRPKTDRGRPRRGRADNKSRGDRGRRGPANDRGGRSSSKNGNRAASGSGDGGGGRRGGQGNRGGSKDSRSSGQNAANPNETAEDTTAVDTASDSRSQSRSDARSSERGRSGNGGDGSGEGGSSRRRRRRPKGSRSGSGSNDNDTANDANKSRGARHDKKTADNKQEETPVEEVAEHLRSFLGGLTEAFGLEGDVDIDTSETDVMVATVQGQHGLMVGPKGRTLDAIQELARVSSQRAAPSSIRIRIDVGGYRKQRAAALGDFARKAADKAVDNGVEVALEPMSPADRKSVHDALVDDKRVETRSVGTEPRRKVVVIPVSGNGSGSDEEE
ncbi:MAG: Jag N-terminal domain-containing protein [Acidimicrobiia bacterium]|nr:Jag N-terminal domain-containing protein [Acidimicrobiia bacterium]